jgi:outer membrane lipoprotein LolB
MARSTLAPAAVMFAGLLAACASVPPSVPTTVAAATDEAFAIDGRLSARQGAQAITAGFEWTHATPRDELVVATPLGQTLAELEGDASVPRVEVRLADGRREEARDWSDIMTRNVGFALPMTWLGAWVRGVPHADAPHSVELDAAGRVRHLRQNGWEIAYAYADARARRPTRVRLSSGDLEIAIVVDRWRP